MQYVKKNYWTEKISLEAFSFSAAIFLVIRILEPLCSGKSNIKSFMTASTMERSPRAPNLYETAVKYAYPDTQIVVDTKVEGNKAIISVKNKCDKIPQKKLDTLFDKFVRLDDNMTRTTRGTGLGLFIVKGLIEAMNGSIRLSSDDEYGFCATIILNIV